MRLDRILFLLLLLLASTGCLAEAEDDDDTADDDDTVDDDDDDTSDDDDTIDDDDSAVALSWELTPPDGAQGVDTFTPFVVEANLPLSATSTLSVSSPAGSVPGSSAVDGSTLTWTPDGPLPLWTTLDVAVELEASDGQTASPTASVQTRDGVWSAGAQLTPTGTNSGEPRAAWLSDDTAVVAWRSNGAIVARSRVDGTWDSEPTPLTDPGRSGQKMALAARDGFAVAGWVEYRAPSNVPVVAVYEGGAWLTSEPVDITDSTSHAAQELDVAMSDAGVATLVWTVRFQSPQQSDLWVSQRLASGWSAPQQIVSTAGLRSFVPRVVAEEGSNATVCWQDRSVAGWPIRCTPVQDGTLQADYTLPDGPSGQEAGFGLAYDPSTTSTFISWARGETYQGTPTWLIARRGSDGVWTPPTELLPATADGVDGGQAEIARGANGQLVAAIRRGGGTDAQVWATERPPGGSWATPTRIDDVPTENLWGPSITVDPFGRAMIAWHGYEGTGEHVRAVRFRPDAGFLEEVTIEAGGTLNRLPAVLAEQGGQVLLVLEDDSEQVLYEATFE